MTVRELIELLKDQPMDLQVIVQKDCEGNGYSPLSSVHSLGYVAETTWYGEKCLLTLTEEDIEYGFTEEDVREDATPAVFLVPVN